MTRKQLLRELDAVELVYWRAKEAIDGPLGAAGDNWRKAGMPALQSRAPVRQAKDQAIAQAQAAMAAFNKKRS